MFNYTPVTVETESLNKYAALLKACFPNAHHLGSQYLHWLYVDNPCGHAVGMDAMVGETLAAHYVCIPTRVVVLGKEVKALLSLNTATHPDYRGKGLFTKLAELTYQAAAEANFSLVYGVANANSTPGFVRKLAFQLASQLDARIGYGRQLNIAWSRVVEVAEFRRAWDMPQLEWRAKNPTNPVSMFRNSNGYTELYANTDKKNILVWGELPIALSASNSSRPNQLKPRLFLGLNPRACSSRNISFSIPNRLRPSPLNFIIRMLDNESYPNSDLVSFSFVDFDAY